MLKRNRRQLPRFDRMTETKEESLKQLKFVPEYGSKGYTIASNVYENAKTYAPEPVKETLTHLEQKTAPYIHRATDTGSQILKTVDSKVCYIIFM